MIQIITQETLTNPVIVGLASMLLVEAGKRIKSIPLDPNNKNQVKIVSGVISLLIAFLMVALHRAEFAAFDWRTALQQIGVLWLEGWMVSHVGYNALPYTKIEDVPPVDAEQK